MNFLKTTKKHADYWRNRKIDWQKSYLDTWNHPHRVLIVNVLSQFRWISLMEIGCGSGANLKAIVRTLPGHQVGGIDINEDAIDLARKSFKGANFKVNPADDIIISDNSVDVILSDAMYIYVDPLKIRKHIREVKRIARNYIVLCEFHSTSWWNRMALRLNTGYFTHDWGKLLKSEGFYDIAIYKIPREAWSGTPWEEFGYIIVAKVPKR